MVNIWPGFPANTNSDDLPLDVVSTNVLLYPERSSLQPPCLGHLCCAIRAEAPRLSGGFTHHPRLTHTHTHIHTAKAHGPSEVLRSNVVILWKNSRHKSLSGRVCFPGKPLAAKHSRVLHSCFMVSGITEFTNTLQASYYPLLASIFIFQP